MFQMETSNASIQIQMMDIFIITTPTQSYDNLAVKSRRGVSLIQYLILQRGKPVPTQRLIRELWSEHRSDFPEAALKTMISRVRHMLREIDPLLADCIISGKSSYSWETQPGISVDVLRIMDIMDALEHNPEKEERVALTEELLELYQGDLYQSGDIASSSSQVNYLHMAYLNAVYQYIELLKADEEYNHICAVCKKAMTVDDLDEQLYIDLLNALVHLNRSQEALKEYRRAVKINKRYFNAPPGEALQEYYEKLQLESQTVQFNLDVIRNELMEDENDRRGPFICDYTAFREFYNIQMRNFERLGSTMFLAVIMVGDMNNAVIMEAGVAGLLEILKRNLRKGDIVTRFSENIVAMLLPTVNYSSGSMVMDRIEELFRTQYSQWDIPFHARIAPLGNVAHV